MTAARSATAAQPPAALPPPPQRAPAAVPRWHAQVTIEEREEYEQHIKMGTVVYAGGRGWHGGGGSELSQRGPTCSAGPPPVLGAPDLFSFSRTGVDYEAILREAEQEADVVIWDGERHGAALAGMVRAVSPPYA